MNRLVSEHPDIVVFDSAGVPRAIVEVKARSVADEQTKQQAVARLPSWQGVEYVILADQKHIQICRREGEDLSEPLVRLITAEVLSLYDPEFSSKEIFEQYFTVLLEAWLRDVAYHWKSQKPPAFDELSSIGLAQRINNGRTEAAFMLDAADRG